jgi:hypothetical protein
LGFDCRASISLHLFTGLISSAYKILVGSNYKPYNDHIHTVLILFVSQPLTSVRLLFIFLRPLLLQVFLVQLDWSLPHFMMSIF